ncbi:hypothetical protein Moror_7906 [Moniliophthora roreri MCA 2997]|uniref:Uncharacterized protein n=1 Tax=Moniliophthora roreri (strain MCA 2997) TaxID=1381753 RepID=V2XB61_MONRO|nr:hypothetical protein Moror_7906 [Moniliophthora roreri MCA 2997]KAI3609013.1 hypothetical protein WG66_010888 [Moniliophthora roreri]
MQQFLILFTSLSILFSSASAVPKDVAIAARDDIPFPIAPKDNPPSQPLEATCSQFNGSPSPCLCNGVEGKLCGVSTINSACTDAHSFQCFSDGSTCDLGVDSSCFIIPPSFGTGNRK